MSLYFFVTIELHSLSVGACCITVICYSINLELQKVIELFFLLLIEIE